MKKQIPLEKDIQDAVCQYLALKKHFFWRQNTAPTVQKSADGWAFRKMGKYAMKGIPDVIVLVSGGFFVGLEIKRPGKKLSEDQVEFKRRCDEIGAEYHLITSIEDLKVIGL